MAFTAVTEIATQPNRALSSEDFSSAGELRPKLNPELVRAQLERVLSSALFKTSTKLSSFLRYVTETVLEGRSDDIKETSIGVAVYGRTPTYDPKLDTVVRSEARRLRSKLDRYFDEEGSLDSIRISLPKGGYVPLFEAVATPPSVVDNDLQLKEVPAQVAASPNIEIRAKGRNRSLIVVSLLSVCLALGISGLLFHRTSSHWSAASHISPLTSFPGESYQPSISPNGKSVAFSWNNGGSSYSIYVLQQGGKPLRITASSGSDIHPVWSPDGGSLAFLRVSGATAQVMMMSFPGGAEKELFALRSGRPWGEDQLGIRNDTGPSWSADGKGLIVSDTSPSGRGLGLYRFDLNTRDFISLTHPASDERDLNPSLSSDGRWLAYARFSSYDSSDVFVSSLTDHKELRLTADLMDIQGLAWSADSREIVFSSNRYGAYGLWAVNLDGSGPAPIPTTGESAIQPAVSRDGRFLVYADSALRSEILKINLEQTGSAAAPLSIAPSTRRSHSAQFSPDGSKIAFVSDRSGKWELWLSNADGTETSQLTTFGAASVGSPRWSPDGKSIAFDARPKGHSAIFVASVDGQVLRDLSPKDQEEKQPAWSPDGHWIYFDSNRGGSMQLWKMTNTGTGATPVLKFAVTDPRVSADGNSLFYTDGTEGLWQMGFDGRPAVQVPGLEHGRFGRLWFVSDRGIYYVNIDGDRSKLMLYDFRSKMTRPVLTLPRDPLMGYPSLSYSTVSNSILFATKEDPRSDLVMIGFTR
ncbi:MAG: WD40-like beta Propeller containing protein [Acidobacteriaceae bacterium]|nr:WD40-like beta Propeller containing protein [Acidobacteriaceae bacterium]